MIRKLLLAVLTCVALSDVSATALRQQPAPTTTAQPATALVSPDGKRAVWVSEDGKSIWSATRPTATAAWSAPARQLTIRGTVRNLAFSPDSKRLAFENPRVGNGNPADNTWGFIVVFDFATRRIAYVDPVFATDTSPSWSPDGRQISFVRTVGTLPGVRLTKPAPQPYTWTPPPPRDGETFSLASVLALPFVYEPSASGDGRSIAYAAREGMSRNIYFMRVGEPARQVATFGDDGQELTEVALSRTGTAVAFVHGATTNPVSLPDPPQPEIWVVGTKSDKARRVGFGTAPRFSADDSQLSWTTPTGRVSARVTLHGGGVTIEAAAPVPAPDGTTPQGLTSPDGKLIAVRRSGMIDIFDVATKSTWQVDNSQGGDNALVWSPDSKFLAYRRAAGGVRGSAGINGYRFNGAPVADQPWSLWVAEPSARESHQVFQARAGVGSVASGPLFWSDDHRIAFQWEGDNWQHYYWVPAAGGAPALMTRGEGDVEFAQISLDRKHLIVTTNIGDLGRRHITIVDFNGGTIAIIKQGAASQWAPVQLADGKLAYLEASHSLPPTVMIRDRDGTTTSAGLPKVAASFPTAALVEPLLVEFPATDGQTAFGQLFVPRQPKGCGIIFAHGGIRRQMLPGFHYMDAYTHLYELNQYLVSRGCVVLSVEYRSSIMRGYAFRNAPGWGHAGASEMLDVVGGAKYLLARADVDKSRGIGVYGLSWGGYITAQALARHSNIFSVGFDMAGVHTSNIPEALPHTAMAFLDKWTSPIFLAQGDDDRNVVFSEGLKLAKALQEKRSQVELVQRVFPNETHDMYLTFENMVSLYQQGADFLLNKLLISKK